MARTRQSAFLRNYPLTLLPNVKEEFGLRGSVIRVVSAAVPIFFESRDGSSSFYLEQGEQIVFDDGNDNIFYQLELYHNSGIAQPVILAVGENASIGSAKVSGIISGTVELGAASLAALESVDLNSATRDLLRFEAYGASYRSNVALAANGNENIFTAAANVNGAILHSAQFLTNGAAFYNAAFLAKATAPTTALDGDGILSAEFMTLNTSYFSGGSLKKPIKIPAGKGLYFVAGAAETNAARSALYTLL